MEANYMIVGERILEVSGTKTPKTNVQGLGINISLEDVKLEGDNLELTYIYNAAYQKDAGSLKIKGVLLAKEDAAKSKNIVDTWKKSKKVPDDYATTVLTAINYSGSANGTLIARVLGLTAPLIPPKIQLSKKEKK
jgi:hypothetical protein